MYFIVCFSLFLTTLENSAAAKVEKLHVCEGANGGVVYSKTVCNGVIAKTEFRNEINSSGWAYLEVETFADYPDEMQAYAAGIAEAHISRQLIKWHWHNTVAGYCKKSEDYCNRLEKYIQENLAWTKSQIEANPRDPYWRQVNLMLVQLSGLEDGYYDRIRTPHSNISTDGLIMMQMSGDLEDLEMSLNKSRDQRGTLFSRESCSAFIKPLPGNTDLLISHVTWSMYQTMLRMQKLYKLPYTMYGKGDSLIPSPAISFSSYPGTLFSIDDFYLLQSGLVVTETTIGNSNESLFQYITPRNTVISWIRVMVANRLASTASEWVDTFVKFNSGTYNNQFMIVDYKKLAIGHPLPKSGLFYVVEQIPGYTKSQDMSSFLAKNGYWPSYNVPYFPVIFNMGGNLDNVKKYGDWFTYDKTPRALIFARDWKNVTDLDSLTTLMRYNNFKNDPLSACASCSPPYSAENAISARNDLNDINGTYPFKQLSHRSHGGTDMKATNYRMAKKLQFSAISGPTFGHLPPFQWSKSDFANTVPHQGHPDLFAFKPVTNKWRFF